MTSCFLIGICSGLKCEGHTIPDTVIGIYKNIYKNIFAVNEYICVTKNVINFGKY